MPDRRLVLIEPALIRGEFGMMELLREPEHPRRGVQALAGIAKTVDVAERIRRMNAEVSGLVHAGHFGNAQVSPDRALQRGSRANHVGRAIPPIVRPFTPAAV